MVPTRRIPRGAIATPLPLVIQRADHTCGAAALLAVCRYFDVGATTEADVVAAMRFGVEGSDPAHLVRAIRRFGLRWEEHRGMTDAALRACLDRGRPVILMLQAWGDRARYRHYYRDHWRDGHWVVAIGYDAEGLYVEDPLLAGARGFVSYAALADRWHDVEGPTRRRVHRYGVAVWSRRPRRSHDVRVAWPLG